MPITLALDLGTSTGWALKTKSGISSGTQSFKTKRIEGAGMKYLRFRKWLDMNLHHGIDEVYWEEVRAHAGTDAAHTYGALSGTLMAWCEENSIQYSSVPVGQIKRSWTGRGNASKQEMIAEANRRGFDVVDDNNADALALLHCVIER